jgi:hypothetical protein
MYRQNKMIAAQLEGQKAEFSRISKNDDDNRTWNKLNATYNLLPTPVELEKIESEIDDVTKFWTRDEKFNDIEVKALCGLEKISSDEVKTIKANDQSDDDAIILWSRTGRKLKLYINLIEMYCAAINCGVVDSEVAKHVYGFKFNRHHNKLQSYITYLRNMKKDNSIYIELEKVTKAWYPQNTPESVAKKY